MGYFYLFSGNSFIIFLRINLLNFAHFKEYDWCLFLKKTGNTFFKARPGPMNATQRFRGLKHYSLLSIGGNVVLCDWCIRCLRQLAREVAVYNIRLWRQRRGLYNPRSCLRPTWRAPEPCTQAVVKVRGARGAQPPASTLAPC